MNNYDDDFDYEWLELDVDPETVFNPMEFVMEGKDEEEIKSRLVAVISRPEYFSFICKYIFNIELLPFQQVIIKELWDRKFPILLGSRGCSKSTCLAIYCLLRCLLIPRRKMVVVGAAFRQSKIVFGYMEDIWNNAPVLKSLCNNSSGPKKDVDKCTMRINGSTVVCLPLGDGERIRGHRAHDIVAEEFQSMPVDIFERIVAGFGNVAQNPVQKVKQKVYEKRGTLNKVHKSNEIENQIIWCGTAYYSFNHFAKYWEKNKRFIHTKGDIKKIQEVLGDADPKGFRWSDYSIMRIPIESLPPGLMDDGMIARLKATVHSGTYNMECNCIFSNDSQGFFKRTLIESCVLTNHNTFIFPSCGEVHFEAMLRGRPGCNYVFGIDPAAEHDNFSIVILEVHEDHRRIVHIWTTTRKRYHEKFNRKLVAQSDYYKYCARKIRDLMKDFPCIEIAMDSQGGGVAIEEALHDLTLLEEGELPIWPCIDEDKEKPTDDNIGLHILRKCNFAKADWLAEANHGLRKDFEDKVILFPFYDTATLELSYQEDAMAGRLYDNLEDCILNIEDLKDELSSIVITTTASGRERWDTPETKTDVGKKTSSHKDRYSALLMANMSARRKPATKVFDNYEIYGGYAKKMNGLDYQTPEPYARGPAWWEEGMNGFEY